MVGCSDFVNHNKVLVLDISILLLACSQDWTCNFQMTVSKNLKEPTPITVMLCDLVLHPAIVGVVNWSYNWLSPIRVTLCLTWIKCTTCLPTSKTSATRYLFFVHWFIETAHRITTKKADWLVARLSSTNQIKILLARPKKKFLRRCSLE